MVALVRHADDLVAEAEREEQLGGVGHEGDDPHDPEEDMALLEDDRIDEALSGGDWRREGDAIVRDLQFRDFQGAIAFVNTVADLAEEANHHPDLLVHGWNKVRLTLSTHSEGGVTQNDLDLAGRIDAVVS
jgi:4a-hydroxytetrahydrobiopterin dehydratase